MNVLLYILHECYSLVFICMHCFYYTHYFHSFLLTTSDTATAQVYDAMVRNEQACITCHESDPMWSHAIYSDAPSLLTIRQTMSESAPASRVPLSDDFSLLSLTLRHVKFRVIKLNRCGWWNLIGWLGVTSLIWLDVIG